MPHLRRPVRGPAAALVILLASNALVGGATAATPFEPGRSGAEAAALLLAETSAPVTIDDAGTRCPSPRLRVQWEPPAAEQYQHGSYLDPVGAPNGPDDRDANGIVVCRDSSFGYVGFEAVRRTSGEWQASAVPASEASTGNSPLQGSPATALPAGLASVQPGSPWYARWGPDIEDLAAYDPQSTCDPSPKVGVAAFRALVRQKFTDSSDLGISLQCSAPGISEHKEGRAWDFGVRVDVPDQAAEANALISWLLATDEHGNRYAMARRLGVMYIIWDGHIWGSYKADEGWRSYLGDNPHTDHVHISFDRAGALGQTSFWKVVPLTGVGEFSSVFSSGGFGLGPVPPPHELGRNAGHTPPPSSPSSGSDQAAPGSPGDSGATTPAQSGATSPGATSLPGTPEPAPAPDPLGDQQAFETTPPTTTDDLLSLLLPPTTLIEPNAIQLPN